MRNLNYRIALVVVLAPLLLVACGKRGNLFLPPKPTPAETTSAPATPPAATHERLPENTR